MNNNKKTNFTFWLIVITLGIVPFYIIIRLVVLIANINKTYASSPLRMSFIIPLGAATLFFLFLFIIPIIMLRNKEKILAFINNKFKPRGD